MTRELPTDTLDDFGRRLEIQTRWADNDAYGHVNNVVYYAYFDTIINRYLIEAGLDIHGPVIGLCVESQCRFLRPLAFPGPVEAGLRVARLGKSSVTYEVGIFGDEGLAALGSFVHVFVDSRTRRPMPIPEVLRAALQKLSRAG